MVVDTDPTLFKNKFSFATQCRKSYKKSSENSQLLVSSKSLLGQTILFKRVLVKTTII